MKDEQAIATTLLSLFTKTIIIIITNLNLDQMIWAQMCGFWVGELEFT